MATIGISNFPGGATRPPFPIPRAQSLPTPTVAYDGSSNGRHYSLQSPQVVDSVSCHRQYYVRNGYKFTRKESLQEKTKNCFGKFKDRVAAAFSSRKKIPYSGGGYRGQVRMRSRLEMLKRVKTFPCDAPRFVFQRLLSCTSSVHVVDHE